MHANPYFPDVLFVSMENWDEVWRRNQFICSGLAKRYPGSKTLFVEPPRDFSHNLPRGGISKLLSRVTWPVPELPNITVTRPPKFLPNSFAWSRRLNEIVERAHIHRVVQRIGIKSPILWLNPHYSVHMIGKMKERAVIYDITDDWTQLSQSKALARLIVDQDTELCKKANAVIVCSKKLFNLKRDLARNLCLIPNGVDAEHYRCVLNGVGSLPADAVKWPKPVLGYTGTIHSDRIDVGLLESLAQGLEAGSIVLIGPNHLSVTDRARLTKYGKTAFVGPVPYKELPQYMRSFDVCIVPHRVTAFTESLNPLKLWEYLAAGKPIVSTNVAGFRDFQNLVSIAADANSFLLAVKKALREDPTKGEARRTEARRHSWESRLDAIEEVINSFSKSHIN